VITSPARTREIYARENFPEGHERRSLKFKCGDINTTIVPEVDFTYFVTKNIGLELIAATTKHSASGRTGTTGSIGKLADTWVLPPTLTAQYHFAPEGKIRPYVGAGLNSTIFCNERASGSLEAAVGPTSAHLSDCFGSVLQAGVDVNLSASMFLNGDRLLLLGRTPF